MTKFCKDCHYFDNRYYEPRPRCRFGPPPPLSLVTGEEERLPPTCVSERYEDSGRCGEEGRNFLGGVEQPWKVQAAQVYHLQDPWSLGGGVAP